MTDAKHQSFIPAEGWSSLSRRSRDSSCRAPRDSYFGTYYASILLHYVVNVLNLKIRNSLRISERDVVYEKRLYSY